MELFRIHLDYLHPWPNQLGFFVARHKGWYAELGWDVDIISDGWDRGTAAQKVARGEYQVAPVRLGELLEMRHTSTPLIGVATLNQVCLEGLFTLRNRSIFRFRDLEGKTVALPSTHPGYDEGNEIVDGEPVDYPPVPRLLEMLRQAVIADGGDFSKVKIKQTKMWEADMRAIEKGYCDAVASVPGWEAMQGISPEEEIIRLRFDEVGVAPHHSYFMSFTEEYVEKHPDKVTDFIRVSARGFKYAYENPEKAITEYGTSMWHVEPDVLLRSVKYMSNSWLAPSGRWGEINFDLVRGYTRWMMEGNFTTATLEDIEGAITNDFNK